MPRHENRMRQARVLLIDDEERILRSLTQSFQSEYEVWSTANPDQALGWVQQRVFHVVLCDQRMPSLPGVELLRRIRQLSPHTVRLLLTGYADIPAIIASINEGEIWRYVAKPWEPAALALTVAQAAEIGLQSDRFEAGAVRARADFPQPVPVLVFDDDPAVAPRIADIGGPEFQIIAATTLETATAFIAAQPAPIVVTETTLGGVDTTPLLHALKQACPDLNLLVLATRQDAGVLIQLVNQCQIFRFLSKPAVPQRVQEALQAARAHQRRLLAGRPTGRPSFEAVGAPATTGLSGRVFALFRRLREERQTAPRR